MQSFVKSHPVFNRINISHLFSHEMGKRCEAIENAKNKLSPEGV